MQTSTTRPQGVAQTDSTQDSSSVAAQQPKPGPGGGNEPSPAPGPSDPPEPQPGDPQPGPDQQIHDPPANPEHDSPNKVVFDEEQVAR